MTTADRDDQDQDEPYPSPDLLREVLTRAAFEPDDESQMVDMAAVGITAL